MSLNDIPSVIRDRQQWVCWRYDIRDGKKTKVPYCPETGDKAETDNPKTWTTFEDAVSAYEDGNLYNGIGFVFSEFDPYCGIDIDGCIGNDGTLSPEALDIIATLNTYTEITPSGKGFHAIVEAIVPEGRKRNKNVEMYDQLRYFTVTGDVFSGSTVEKRQAEVNSVHKKYLAAAPQPERRFAPRQDSVPLGDSALLERMFESKNGEKIKLLWEGDHAGAGYASQSEGDAAFCSHLMYFSDGDEEQTDRIFRESGLYRKKWDKRHHANGMTYGEGTIVVVSQGAKDLPLSTLSTLSTDLESHNHIKESKCNNNNNSKNGVYIESVDNVDNDNGDAESVDNVDNVDNGIVWEPLLTIGEYVLPKFPIHCLPPWLSEYLLALAATKQTPICLPGMMSLSVLAACCARKFEVEAKEGWREPLNLYTATTMSPASRKSAVVEAVCQPLHEWESGEMEKYSALRAKITVTREVLEDRKKQATQKAARAKPEEDRVGLIQEAQAVAEELNAIQERGEFRLFVEDCTPEKMVGLLADNDGRIAVLSAEGDAFDIIAGRYSDKANLGVYLKGHTGEPLRVDRIGRKTEYVEKPSLTIGVAIQPDVLRGLLTKPNLRGRGLLARFLYSIPENLIGYRTPNSPKMPRDLEHYYWQGVQRILNLKMEYTDDGKIQPVIIYVDHSAQPLLEAYQVKVEKDLRPGEALFDMQDWGGKLVGAVIRIAALLHIADYAMSQEIFPLGLPESTLARAIEIGAYLSAHARAAFSEMGSDKAMDDARFILEWVRRRGEREISLRDLHRYHARRFLKSEDMTPALMLLRGRNYLEEILPTAEEKRHNAKSRYVFSPKIWD